MKNTNVMKKRLRYKLIISVILASAVYILFSFIGGYRLTSMQAVKSCPYIPENSKVFGEVKRDWATVYLLDTSKGIKTALTEKKGLLWSCPSTTYFFDDIIKNDAVKTVGWQSLTDGIDKQITVFAVQTTDPNVKIIEVGSDSNRLRKPITLNETVIFSWDKVITLNDINAIASDKDNLQLYKYEFNPKNLNVTKSGDLRWYSVNNG